MPRVVSGLRRPHASYAPGVLAARSTVRLSESLAVGKSFSLVLWSLVVMVTAQASVVILLNLHPQARG